MKTISRINEQGSAHAVVIAALSVALVAAVGYIFWTNVVQPNDKSEPEAAVTSSPSPSPSTSTAPAVKEGTIQGSLTYPTDGGIPADFEVRATNLETGKEYVTKEHIKGAGYTYGSGYKLAVPAGKYHVYGVLTSKPQEKAYYNKFVTCGMAYGCNDFTKIEVTVEPGKETADIMVGDWYNI